LVFQQRKSTGRVGCDAYVARWLWNLDVARGSALEKNGAFTQPDRIEQAMKRSHIMSLLLVAILVGTFIATFTSTSRSVGFAQAANIPGEECKVSGTLVREQPVIYDPIVDPTKTVFHMEDKSGAKCKVILEKAKPTGLENSESIDLYGAMVDGEFHATEMLMKCPSKYNESNHVLSLETDESTS